MRLFFGPNQTKSTISVTSCYAKVCLVGDNLRLDTGTMPPQRMVPAKDNNRKACPAAPLKVGGARILNDVLKAHLPPYILSLN
jgi:hypothetical protein